jgi:hypothetical protein
MNRQYLAVAIGLSSNSIHAGNGHYPNPSASSVTALFAPCQAFDVAIGNSVTMQEAVQMGLLTPDLQPQPATQLAQNHRFDAYVR